MKYFTRYIPGSGTYIMYDYEGTEFQFAVMRCQLMEKSIQENARRIVASLNYCINKSIEELEND